MLAHRRQHLLGDEERAAAGDVLRGVEHLHRDVLEQFLLRRQVAAFEVAGVVDQDIRIAGFVANSWRTPPRWSPARRGPARRSCTRRPAPGSPLPGPRRWARCGSSARRRNPRARISGRWRRRRPSARRPAGRDRRAPYRERAGCCGRPPATWRWRRPPRRPVCPSGSSCETWLISGSLPLICHDRRCHAVRRDESVELAGEERDAVSGSRVLVTGGGSGIGQQVCYAAMEEGARVAVGDLDLERAEATAAEIRRRKGEAHAFQVDVADPDSVSALCRGGGNLARPARRAGQFRRHPRDRQRARPGIRGMAAGHQRQPLGHLPAEPGLRAPARERGQAGQIVNLASPSG